MIGSILLAGFKKSKQMARMANSHGPIYNSIVDGDTKNGVFLMGQVAGMISHIPSVAELMDELIQEAEDTIRKMSALS